MPKHVWLHHRSKASLWTCTTLLTNISALMEVVRKNQDADNYCNYQKVRSSNKKKKIKECSWLFIKFGAFHCTEKKKGKISASKIWGGDRHSFLHVGRDPGENSVKILLNSGLIAKGKNEEQNNFISPLNFYFCNFNEHVLMN